MCEMRIMSTAFAPSCVRTRFYFCPMYRVSASSIVARGYSSALSDRSGNRPSSYNHSEMRWKRTVTRNTFCPLALRRRPRAEFARLRARSAARLLSPRWSISPSFPSRLRQKGVAPRTGSSPESKGGVTGCAGVYFNHAREIWQDFSRFFCHFCPQRLKYTPNTPDTPPPSFIRGFSPGDHFLQPPS